MGVRRRCLAAVFLLIVLLAPGHGVLQAQLESPEQVVIYLFWGEGCPYCRAEKAFLTELEARYPQITVREYEIYHNPLHRDYLSQMLAQYGLEPSGVPTTFIGGRYWVGFNERVARQIEEAVIACSETACTDPGRGVLPVDDQTEVRAAVATTDAGPSAVETLITVPLIGEIDVAGLSLGVTTALIAFVDGFNPCSLWVLSLLLGLVIHSGSRRKTLIVGLTFLTVASAVYVLFIVGLFSVFSFVGFLGWIQIAVALLALTFGLINVKDYFWFKKGISLTIPDKHKPKLYRDMRGLMAGDKSTLALIAATGVMAAGITLIELPCTSGLPMLWTNIIAAQAVSTVTFVLLLGLYMLIFLIDELIVFGSVVFTLKASRFEEKQGRILKLIGGMVMLVLAVVLLIDPAIMNDFTGSLVVFGIAFAAAAVVLVVHQKILPHDGLYSGTKSRTRKPRPGTGRG